jgi:hypothetical protein
MIKNLYENLMLIQIFQKRQSCLLFFKICKCSNFTDLGSTPLSVRGEKRKSEEIVNKGGSRDRKHCRKNRKRMAGKTNRKVKYF